MAPKTSLALLGSAALALAGSPASADLILPSVITMISAPGPYSLLLLPAVLTVPMLLAVSLLEAAVCRLFLKERRFRFLLTSLFLINAFTSAIGMLVAPEGYDSWSGLLLAYLITVPLEAILVFLVLMRRQRQPLPALYVSAAMNAASYSFIALIVAALIYIPLLSCKNNLPASSLSGTLSLRDLDGKEVASVDLGNSRDLAAKAPPTAQASFEVVNQNGKRFVVNRSTGKVVGAVQSGYAFRGLWDISSDGHCYANWVYGDARMGVESGDLVIGDTKNGKVKVLPDPQYYVFEPRGHRLAVVYRDRITIYNPDTGTETHFTAPCISRPDGTCWSPDGRFLAYLADTSPYKRDLWEPQVDSVRLITVDGRRSLTARREKQTADWWEIEWQP